MELYKKPSVLDFEVSFAGGTAAAALTMEVYFVYDKLYTIKGAEDEFKMMY
jgi:hypothetical protein